MVVPCMVATTVAVSCMIATTVAVPCMVATTVAVPRMMATTVAVPCMVTTLPYAIWLLLWLCRSDARKQHGSETSFGRQEFADKIFS